MHYKPHAVNTFYKHAVISRELMRSLLQMLKSIDCLLERENACVCVCGLEVGGNDSHSWLSNQLTLGAADKSPLLVAAVCEQWCNISGYLSERIG